MPNKRLKWHDVNSVAGPLVQMMATTTTTLVQTVQSFPTPSFSIYKLEGVEKAETGLENIEDEEDLDTNCIICFQALNVAVGREKCQQSGSVLMCRVKKQMRRAHRRDETRREVRLSV
jgi:hypothetical protein